MPASPTIKCAPWKSRPFHILKMALRSGCEKAAPSKRFRRTRLGVKKTVDSAGVGEHCRPPHQADGPIDSSVKHQTVTLHKTAFQAQVHSTGVEAEQERQHQGKRRNFECTTPLDLDLCTPHISQQVQEKAQISSKPTYAVKVEMLTASLPRKGRQKKADSDTTKAMAVFRCQVLM